MGPGRVLRLSEGIAQGTAPDHLSLGVVEANVRRNVHPQPCVTRDVRPVEVSERPPTQWPDELLAAYDARRLALVRLAYVMTGDSETAEDIVQEVFLATCRRWDGVRDVNPYLRAAVVNAARSWLRRKKLERAQPAVSDSAYLGAPDEMWDALGRLKPRARMAVVLRYYEGLPDAEIADLLGCRETTVRTTIHRALGTLRKEIER